MDRADRTSLLDELSDLADLLPDGRQRRLGQMPADERLQLARLLALLESDSEFLESPPPLIRGALDLLSATPPEVGSSILPGPPLRAARTVGIPDDAVPQVDGYVFLARLGEGATATVWRARQLATGREVAVKLMSSFAIGSPRARVRFEREVELAARLEHPHVARVYDSGVHRGAFFCAMELIDGLPLDRYVASCDLPQRRILGLMRDICRAVGHAHARAVVHRDLKPSNILVAGDGSPHVLDFGLAKAVEAAGPELSTEGMLAGTPAYMSPEQADGRAREADLRSDVYSLGVILFRLLTGRGPHDTSGSPAQVIRRIAQNEPMRPRAANPALDRELEAILLKALSRDPEGRYLSANALADDLENYQAGRPVTARPMTAMYVARKWAWRHRPALFATATILSLLAGGSVYSYRSIIADRNRADSARRDAEQVSRFLQGVLLSASPMVINGQRIDATMMTRSAEKELDAGALRNQPRAEAMIHRVFGVVYANNGHANEAVRHLELYIGEMEALNRAGANRLGGQAHGTAAMRYCRALLDTRDPKAALAVRHLIGWRRPPAHADSPFFAHLPDIEIDDAAATQLDTEALRILSSSPDPSYRVQAIDVLARMAWEQGRLDEAEAKFRQELGILVQRDQPRPRDPSQLDVLTALMRLMEQRKRYAQAADFSRRGIDFAETFWGNRKSMPSFVYLEHALLLDHLGDARGAEEWGFKAVDLLRYQGVNETGTRMEILRVAELLNRHIKYALAAQLAEELWSRGSADHSPTKSEDEPVVVAECLADSYAGMGDAVRTQEWRQQVVQSLRAALPKKQKAADRFPRNPRFLRDLAQTYARVGDFSHAAAAFQELVELAPANHLNWHQALPLLLQTGDVAAYRRLRSQALRRFSGSIDPYVADRIAKSCLLFPLQGEELAQAVALADRAAAADPKSPGFCLGKGVAQYRTGHWGAALEWLEKAADGGRSPAELMRVTSAKFFLAMAYQRLGNSAKALAAFQQGATIADNQLPKPGESDLTGSNFQDWILCERARHEAEVLLRSH